MVPIVSSFRRFGGSGVLVSSVGEISGELGRNGLFGGAMGDFCAGPVDFHLVVETLVLIAGRLCRRAAEACPEFFGVENAEVCVWYIV